MSDWTEHQHHVEPSKDCHLCTSSFQRGTTGAEGLASARDAEAMLRRRWKGDLQRIPLGKVVEFMQSFAEAHLGATTQRAPVTPRQFSDEELRKVVNGIGDNWHNNLTNAQVYAMADKYIRPLLAAPAPVTTPGWDEGPREAKLRRALRKYGVHQERCEAFLDECTCGLEAALAAAKEPRG